MEQFGWEEFAADAANVRDVLPEDERTAFGILAGNYGEAGASSYGRQYGLPKSCAAQTRFTIAAMTSGNLRLSLPSVSTGFLSQFFGSVEVVTYSRNAHGFMNEETTWHRKSTLP